MWIEKASWARGRFNAFEHHKCSRRCPRSCQSAVTIHWSMNASSGKGVLCSIHHTKLSFMKSCWIINSNELNVSSSGKLWGVWMYTLNHVKRGQSKTKGIPNGFSKTSRSTASPYGFMFHWDSLQILPALSPKRRNILILGTEVGGRNPQG